MRLILNSVLCLIMLSACSCVSGQHVSDTQADPASAEPPAQLADIPFPDDDHYLRGVSTTTELWTMGRNAVLSDASALQVGPAMFMPAGAGELTWAIYELYPGSIPFDRIRVDLSGVSDETRVWLGAADYGANLWAWQPYFPLAPWFSVARDVVSPGGGTYLAVAVYDDAQATVDRIWIEHDVEDWEAHQLDPAGHSGLLHSMATVDGHPAVLLQDPGGGGLQNLLYAYTTEDIPNEGDWTITTVLGGYIEPHKNFILHEHDGSRPGFALINSTDQLLYYYADNAAPAGFADWSNSLIDDAEDGELGLANVDGAPAMVYEKAQPASGTRVEYTKSSQRNPGPSSWDKFTVAASFHPDQDYEGLALGTLQGWYPAVAYWNETASNFYYFSSVSSIPSDPEHVTTTLVDIPVPLGGSDPRLIEWHENSAIFYDTVNSVMPLYARPLVRRPETPEQIGNRHRISHMSADSPAVAVNGDTIGIAFREPIGGTVRYASYTGDAAGLDSGEDWRFATVDPRKTFGNISLCYIFGGIPAVGYHVDDDGDNGFYFARMVPTT